MGEPGTQLRIALVCYGGVSLAIYEHGVTKELHKLVRASRRLAQDRDAGTVSADPATRFPEPDTPDIPEGMATGASPEYDTEAVYYAALAELGRDRPLDVVLDVISGTSAGGINGVFLGRALAEGRSLSGVRSVWIEDGDLETLLHGHPLVPFPKQARIVSKLGVALARLLEPDHHADGPLNGERMSQLLYRALRDMRLVDEPAVPPAGSLDLFTTATDVYGYSTAVPTGVGGISHTDRSFRQVLAFHVAGRDRDAGGEDGFADAAVPALAFAARATSSFPGAFPAVSIDSFAAAVHEHDADADVDPDAVARHFQFRGEYGSDPARAWYMDGGVLDNGPFDLVIDAIAGKRADGPVARELVYLEPDPGSGPAAEHEHDTAPPWLSLVLDAKLSIPAHSALVGALDRLRELNAAVAEVGAIAQAQERLVVDHMRELGLGGGDDGAAGYDAMITASARIRDTARSLAGLGFSAYCRLRAEAVADQLAGQLAHRLGYPLHSNRSSFVVAAVQAWLRGTQDWLQLDAASLEQALGAVDVPFRVRRANFVLQGVNTLIADPALTPERRGQLAELKTVAWDYLERLRELVDRAGEEALPAGTAVFGPDVLTDAVALTDPAGFAAAHAAGIDVAFRAYRDRLAATGSSRELWQRFAAITAGWDEDTRAALASRYLMFPVWDAVIFPVVALAKLPQLSPIAVTRFSPLDATTLRPDPAVVPGEHKLRGVAVAHFGGFFDEGWRENDYLWGRLDGAELIMRLLGRHAGGVDLTRHLQAAFRTVLEVEAPVLDDVADTVRALQAAVPAVHLGS